MKECKKLRELLVAFACDELENSEKHLIQKHLQTCRTCSEELGLIRVFIDDVERLEKQSEKMMQKMDWENTEREIKRNAVLSQKSISRFRFSPPVWSKALIPIMSSIFLFGILVGYLLFHSRAVDSPNSFGSSSVNLSLDRVKTTLARKEILGYFRQIHLLLIDVVKLCEYGSSSVQTIYLDQVQIKQLLMKNRYFSQDLNEPQLMSSGILLKKIELILYEILIMTEKNTCHDIQRLQDIIRRERIFLKIRLLEKELLSDEV